MIRAFYFGDDLRFGLARPCEADDMDFDEAETPPTQELVGG